MQPSLELMRDRERDGRCGECGMQTHKFKLFGFCKESLTIANVVFRGRCLLCHPVDDANEDSDNIPLASVVAYEIIEHKDALPEPSAPPLENNESPSVYIEDSVATAPDCEPEWEWHLVSLEGE